MYVVMVSMIETVSFNITSKLTMQLKYVNKDLCLLTYSSLNPIFKKKRKLKAIWRWCPLTHLAVVLLEFVFCFYT